ncbi:DNA-binding HxlR family transcriptional regulator [Mycobacteroides chelonae]|nr:DNA-binding HxlR family transcriptional regulator [Mycobacteroides chelonae]
MEYALTPLGVDLHGICAALVRWARTHHEEIRSHRTVFDFALVNALVAK